jgi:ketosteroid isomerase-like protein
MRMGLLALTLLLRTAPAAESVSEILQRQTQELFDAIPAGAAAVWTRYLDDDTRYTDEAGQVSSKAALISQMKPFPKEITGAIQVTGFVVKVHGPVAIATHLDDERETYYGHELHCQYRTTDTWLKTEAGWRLIAGQVLALRTDPPAAAFTAGQIREYTGRYILAPSKIYEIRAKNGALEGQETGRVPEVLRAELPDLLFVPGKPRYRKLFLRDSSGRITGFAERREAWDLVWKRLP